VQLQYVQLITDKINIADESNGYSQIAILISVIRMIKIQNPLPFHKFCQKLANSDVTKEALNCNASLLQLTVLMALLFSSQNKFSPNPVPAASGFEFLNPARSGFGQT